jgi:DNA-binding transcriptional LysR family regulator
MNPPNPSVEDLRIFTFVSRLSSFTGAALQLGVPRPTVSTSIRRLEMQLGVRLLQRTTRKVVLTHEGRELLRRSERLLDEYEELAVMFRMDGSSLSGYLRVDMPLGMATGLVMAMLPEFTDRHPQLQVDIFSTDRRVDVVKEGFDCVVRAGSVVDESLACRPLGRLPLISVASRQYVQRYGKPQRPSDLADHWLVRYQPNPADPPVGFTYSHGDAQAEVPMAYRLTVNNSAAYNAACRASFGIIQIPRATAAPDIENGSLVEVMERFPPAPLPINLLYPHRRHLPARVRLFGDWLHERLQLPSTDE